MKHLVIVESPTKARTISKFLGDDYEIRFSMGHVMDLPKSKLSIDIKNDFKPLYEVIADKKSLIAELKSLAKNVDNIILATDPDREGEAIAAHIAQQLAANGLLRSEASKGQMGKNKKDHKPSAISNKPIQRIAFHEITKEAVEEALSKPRSIDTDLVDAQTARRVLDRLVGYELSPILWRKVRRGLSAGRVQSVALRLIVQREREIGKFAKSNYWTIHALLIGKKGKSEFELIEIDAQSIEKKEKYNLYDGEYTTAKTIIDTEKKATEITSDLNGLGFVVADITKKQAKRSPNAPYTTSTLQQEASRRLGLSGKRTMSLAQKLYEEGFITYHRTDSTAISAQAIKQIRGHVEKEYGNKYLPAAPRLFKGKQKNAQEAHEAIRMTDVSRVSSVVSSQMGADYAKLYDLIWKRTVASQMSDAMTESTAVYVDAKGKHNYKLKAGGSVLLFDGFLKLTPEVLNETQIPQFEAGESLKNDKIFQTLHETAPPPRYNDASLIKTLEEKGIGRPSTYASIVATLTDRAYVERIEKKFVPTPIGMSVNDFLVKNFSEIDDIPFTAGMEDSLDLVANGTKNWVAMMNEFYTPFSKSIKDAGDSDRVKIEIEETEEICPTCGNLLIIRHGKFGKFFACSNFPECKFTRTFVEQTDILCPKDGGDVIIRKTRKGRKFYGCANYPACTFAAWKLEEIKKNVDKPTA